MIGFEEATKQFLDCYKYKDNSIEKEYRQSLKLVYKIEKEIGKLLVGCGNPRILINHTVIFLNAFGAENAQNILHSMIPLTFHRQLNTVLFVLGIIPSSYDIDGSFYKILEKELQ